MWKKLGVYIGLCGIVASCGSTPTPAETAVAPATVTAAAVQATTDVASPDAPTASPSSGSQATPTTFVLPTSTPSNIDAVDATAIAATMEAGLPATATPDASGLAASLQGETAVVGLLTTAETAFFATITTGMMDNFEDPHPLVMYRKDGADFREVTRYDFVDNEYIGGIDVLSEYTDNSAYFLVSGGIGAHSTFSTLFSFDGDTLRKEQEFFSSSGGGAVDVVDLDGDGLREIIADNTDYYIFCYACGVREYGEIVYVWDGTAFVEQKLVDSADPILQKAIVYARAGRWNMVAATLPQVATAQNVADKWTVIQLERMAQARKPGNEDVYPFLEYMFYGDFTTAVDMMRKFPVNEVVDENGSFIEESMAAGFGDSLVENVVRLTSTALSQDESLTSAQFLRGWALTLLDPRNPEGLADLQAVATADAFYAAVRDAVVSR